MKANKKLLASAMALGLAGLTTVGSTYAWFSMNRTVSATNMQVKATTPASLVISSSKNMSENKTSISYGTATNELAPATHDHTEQFNSTNLKYVKNATDVDPKTGLVNSPVYEVATNTGSVKYYVDYTCYIASSGSELTNQDLKASLYTNADVTEDTHKAISVDFYVATVDTDTLGTYVSTLNLSTLDAANHESKAPATIITAGSIPMANGETHFVRIDMRVYFDGDLKNTAGNAYVRNDGVNTDTVTFGVKFTTSDHA